MKNKMMFLTHQKFKKLKNFLKIALIKYKKRHRILRKMRINKRKMKMNKKNKD
jgi:hypothetical protein